MRFEEEFKDIELKEVMVGDECAKYRDMLETRCAPSSLLGATSLTCAALFASALHTAQLPCRERYRARLGWHEAPVQLHFLRAHGAGFCCAALR